MIAKLYSLLLFVFNSIEADKDNEVWFDACNADADILFSLQRV